MTPLYIILVNFEQCKEASKELVYGNNEIEITEALVAWRGKAFQKKSESNYPHYTIEKVNA